MNKYKFAVPIMIVLIIGVYLSFFSPKAVGNNSTTIKQAVKPSTIIADIIPEPLKFTESEQEGILPEKDSKPLEETVMSLTALSIVDPNIDNEAREEINTKLINTKLTKQPEQKNLVAQATKPTSRGTSSQKQTFPKAQIETPEETAPIKKPIPTPETKAFTDEIKPEAPNAMTEIVDDKKETITLNPELFKQDLNSYVLDLIKTYELGKYPYLLNNDYANYNGVTTNIVYQDNTIAKANPNGDRASHCVGITFEVFFKAMQERNTKLGISPEDFNGMNGTDLRNFMLNWFVSDGIKPQQNCSVAIEKYGLGKRIYNLEDAKAGDFIDISRENNTGHTAVFLNWIKKDGKIVGLKYWGSQSSTKGIAYKEEYFNIKDTNGNKYGNVMFDQVYIGRVGAVEDYKDFK